MSTASDKQTATGVAQPVKVNIWTSVGKTTQIQTTAQTWGELKSELRQQGITYEGMKVVNGLDKSNLELDGAVLKPSANGQVMLFFMPAKTKSGAAAPKKAAAKKAATKAPAKKAVASKKAATPSKGAKAPAKKAAAAPKKAAAAKSAAKGGTKKVSTPKPTAPKKAATKKAANSKPEVNDEFLSQQAGATSIADVVGAVARTVAQVEQPPVSQADMDKEAREIARQLGSSIKGPFGY